MMTPCVQCGKQLTNGLDTFGPVLDPLCISCWLDRESQTLKAKCPDCNGSGEDLCPHCGQNMTCDKCGGSGEVDLTRNLTERDALRKHDEELLKRWNAALAKEQQS